MRKTFLGVLLLASALSACTKRIVQPPPAAFVSLGGLTTGYRDWSSLPDVCVVDPLVLQSDLDSMSALLAMYLEKTAADPAGPWDESNLAIAEKGEAVLPVALELEVKTVENAKKSACTFTGLDKALELNRKALERVTALKGKAPLIRARGALQRWKDSLAPATADAKTRVCDAKPKAPAVYFASEDEKGKAEWLFCDGAVVSGSPGSPPSLTTQPPAPAAPPPPPAKKGKKAPPPPPAPAVDAKSYLDAAAAFPASDVSRAPKLPSTASKKRDDGAAEPKDG